MADKLIHSPTLRWFVKNLGLPLPLPPILVRSQEPWNSQELKGYKVKVSGNLGLTALLQSAGAATVEGNEKVDALVLEVDGPQDPKGLDAVYSFFKENLSNLKRNGKVLVVQRHHPQDAVAEAAHRALDGIVRSIAKETGRKGITANRIVFKGSWDDMLPRVEGPIRFLLSRYAAFVDGQTLWVDGQVRGLGAIGFTMPLSGKTALVTGAARGIGEAIARSLAREGAKVIIVDRPEEADTARELAKQLNGVLLLQDISQPDAPKAIQDFLTNNHHKLDILVHNAGITRDKTLAKMDEQRWKQVLNVNLNAIININDTLLPQLNEGGRMIAMSSISGFAGNFGQANYAATKAALIGYVQGLAGQVSGRGITANAIAPGFIETAMTAKMPFMSREGGRRLSNLQQGGLPEDIAEATLFLVSPGAVGITGQTLRVCGGSIIGA